MITLIIVQTYWIKNVIDIKEQQFIQIVNQTLNKIINKIEEQETIIFISDYLDMNITNKKNLKQNENNYQHNIPDSQYIFSQFDSLF
ncbi:MAG: hypothetical protein JXB17_00465, partial [Bacteroidales bacterium]|nr:hypothetical protein [Bacteroidales bacterium]